MTSVLFLAAAALALIFAANLVQRYWASRAPVYAWWTLSFVLYAVAFLMESATVSSNWHLQWEYQLYIIASAGLVGAMSVGTTYLALPRSKLPTGYAIYFVAAELTLAVFALVNPPVLHGSWSALNAGKNAIVGPTQIVYLMLSAIGGPIVVFGALLSWWKTRQYYTLLIAIGALIPSAAGAFASQDVATTLFPLMNIFGLILIFLGYLNASPKSKNSPSKIAA